MHKITNRTAQPHDIHTRNGVKPIHAHGTLTAELDPAYLEIIKLGFDVEEVGARSGVKDAPVVEPDAYDPRVEYEDLTGKEADKRWGDARVSDEVEKIKAD